MLLLFESATSPGGAKRLSMNRFSPAAPVSFTHQTEAPSDPWKATSVSRRAD
jgi:hypothetical protein